MASSMKIKFNSLLPGSYMTIQQRLARGIWPWTEGPRARLPMHYKLRYIENHMREPPAVHYDPDTRKYYLDKHGQRRPVQNVPVPLIFPNEANKGLWGGEAFLQGMRKKGDDPFKPRVWRLWRPFLTSRVFYSEILDKWMAVTVTMRTMDLVDEAGGFDQYILSTHEVDLCSRLGMKLKAMMLKTLNAGTLYPDDPVKREAILKKYEHHMIPDEEIEWLGLTIEEAERKQEELEEAEYQANLRPLKEKFMDELISKMKNHQLVEDSEEPEEEEGKGGWMKKVSDMNPFKSKS